MHPTALLFALLVAQPPAEAKTRIGLDYKSEHVESRDKDGKLLWSVPLKKPLARHRDPHVVEDADRVYVSHAGGVSALDRRSGKVLWHSEGPHDRMLVSGTLLLATECEWDATTRLLVSRDVRTGKEVFRTPLPTKDFDPYPIRELGGVFLVQSSGPPGDNGLALLIDRAGKVRHRFDRLVVAGLSRGEDRMILTDKDVLCLDRDWAFRWTIPMDDQRPAGGGMLPLADGDAIAFLHGSISDSGVEVIRLSATTGKLVWRTKCKPLGVDHSKYRHEAFVEVDGGILQVKSKGSSGTFTERLDLASGRLKGRQEKKDR